MTGAPALYLIDTSAGARASDPAVAARLDAIIRAGVAARCVTTDLEAGYSARDAKELDVFSRRRASSMRELAVDAAAADRARAVQLLLARAGKHRAAGAFDLLTAAIAERSGATIVHYDADFEHIAGVTGQLHQWVVPRGSID